PQESEGAPELGGVDSQPAEGGPSVLFAAEVRRGPRAQSRARPAGAVRKARPLHGPRLEERQVALTPGAVSLRQGCVDVAHQRLEPLLQGGEDGHRIGFGGAGQVPEGAKQDEKVLEALSGAGIDERRGELLRAAADRLVPA